MKKLIVLLLAFAMVGGVFAQAAAAPAPALVFSGYLNTGFQYDSTTDDLYLYNKDAGNMTRVRWNADYTNGDFGVHFRLQNSDVGVATGTQLFTQALVWGNLLDKMVYFKVGKLNDYTWATAYNSWGHFDGQTGAQIQLKPIAGLNAGIFLPLGNKAAVPPTSQDLADVLANMSIAGKYTADGVGTFLANLNLGNTANALYVGADISAVENLTLLLEANFADLADVANTLIIDEYLSYAMGDLAVGVWAEEALGATFYWAVAPEVSYTMGKTELGASFTYDSTKAYSIDPYAKFTLGAKSAAKVYASYDGAFTVGTNLLFSF
jgi:hypothetical protein